MMQWPGRFSLMREHVNAINEVGKSPLAWATKENSKEMVKLLEMHGAK
jgi:ankyrin repeat protein